MKCTEFKGTLEIAAAAMAYHQTSIELLHHLAKATKEPVNLKELREAVKRRIKSVQSAGSYETEIEVVEAGLRAIDQFFDGLERVPADESETVD